MGLEENKTNLLLSNLLVEKKSRGNLFTEKPVFCENGNSLIISSGQSCHLYNTSTGNHVKKLFQCADDIISYQLHPLLPFLLIAVTENGELTIFNLKTSEIEHSVKLLLNSKILKGQKLAKFNVENEGGDENFDWETQPVDSLSHRKFLYAEVRPFQGNSSEMYVWATWCLNDELQSHLSAFTYQNGKQIKEIYFHKAALKKCYLNFAMSTIQGSDVFVGMSNNYVVVAHFETKKSLAYSFRKHFVGHNIKLTCIAFHPVECSFATGDSLGRVLVWRNIFEKHPLKDIFHWHTLPVHDIVFSKYGNYLFSGGEENVLVKWSLTSRNKEFLPRLSSAIHHLSAALESSLLSVSTLDNRILVINFNFQNISTIQHFSRWSVLKSGNKVNVFTIDPTSSCLVLNGKTGHIQFLSLKEDGKFMYTFDVTNRNFITSDSNRVIENTEVTHAKFNKSGKWLVTSESRKDGLFRESRLKFWRYHEKAGSFELNTNVELPHEETGVYSLEISSDDKVATTGADKKFRLWATLECQQGSQVKEMWSVQGMGKYRNLRCSAADFSKDASLIAVGFGPVLTIWDTSSCALKCSLSVPHRKDDLKYCKFGNNELSHLVVTGTEFCVCSWNTITLSMIWTVPLKLSILVSDPFSIYMSAFSVDNRLIVFNPAAPAADFSLKSAADSPVVAALSSRNENGGFSLYFLTSDQELFCLEDADKFDAAVSSSPANAFLTPYSAQVPQIQNQTDFDRRKTIVLNRKNPQLVSALLDSPAHTLPNPSLLCKDVLKGLLIFSDGQPAEMSSTKEKKSEDVLEVSKTQATAGVDSLKMEAKLVNLVKTIFV